MPELGSYGSVRGARGNSRPYREPRSFSTEAAGSAAGPSSAFAPGCVKTCAREERAELFSLLPSPDSARQHFCFLN